MVLDFLNPFGIGRRDRNIVNGVALAAIHAQKAVGFFFDAKQAAAYKQQGENVEHFRLIQPFGQLIEQGEQYIVRGQFQFLFIRGGNARLPPADPVLRSFIPFRNPDFGAKVEPAKPFVFLEQHRIKRLARHERPLRRGTRQSRFRNIQ